MKTFMETIMNKKLLRTKFVRSISLITLAGLVVTSVIMFLVTTNLFWNSKEDFMEQATLVGRAEVSAWFSDKETLLKTVAEDMRLFTSSEQKTIEDYLSHYNTQYSYLADIYVALPDNRVYSGAYWIPDAHFDASQQSWYLDAKSANGLVYADPYIDEMSGLMIITLSTPVTDKNGRDLGVMAMDIKLDSLVDYINSQSIQGTTGSAFLLDKQQRFIAHQNAAFLPRIENGKDVHTSFADSGITMGSNISEIGTTLAKGKNYKGQSSYISLVTIPENSWSYGFSVPVSDYNGVFALLLLELVGITLLLMIAAVILSQRISDKLLQPIQAIIHAADHLAQGDIHVEIEVTSEDELGHLANQFKSMIASTSEQIQAMQKMAAGDFSIQVTPKCTTDELSLAINQVIGRLRELISRINDSASSVAAGTNEIADGAQYLALGATEQASAVEQLNAAVADIAQQAEQNEEIVQSAIGYVGQANGKLTESDKHMQKLNAAMMDISTCFKKISGISVLIEDIASQINLLSLNASIEAAHAGDGGRGFAVVANEVRNLAKKTGQATKETKDLIKASADAIKEGLNLSSETTASLQEISEAAQYVVQSMEMIRGASSKQALAIEQVNQGLSEVSAVVQTNAATAEESSASTEELAALAQFLQHEVGKFKLNYEGVTQPGMEQEPEPEIEPLVEL